MTFRLGDVRVRVHAGFWLLLLLFSLPLTRWWSLLAPIVVGACLLAHEWAHVLVLRRLGGRPTLTLRLWGGELGGWPGTVSRPGRVLVSLAGPAVSAGLAFVFYVVATRVVPGRGQAFLALMGRANLVWCALSLLPVARLDGQRVLHALTGSGHRLPWLVAAIGLLLALYLPAVRWMPGLAVSACFGVALGLLARDLLDAMAERTDARASLFADLARAQQTLAHGHDERATSEVQRIHVQARSRQLRTQAARFAVQIELARGDGPAACRLLRTLPAESLDVTLEASVADACGDDQGACAWLEDALLAGSLDGDGMKLLVDIHVREGRLRRALEASLHGAYLLTAEERARVTHVLTRTRPIPRDISNAFEDRRP